MASNPVREYLVVVAGGQHFAVATVDIKVAVAAQPVTPLPFVPPFVEGLVNINERIVPQLDLATLLGLSALPGGELVLVETARSPCALRVAQILGKAEVATDALVALDGGESALPVRWRFEWEAGSALVLDLERIGGMVGGRELPAGERGLLGRLDAAVDTATEALLECIELRTGSEHHALLLADVVEIIDLPAATPVPGAPAGVEGLAMVRDEVLLVLSLAALLGAGKGAHTGGGIDGRGSVIVVERDGTRYGLRVDAVEGLRQVAPDALRRIDDPASEIEGVLAHGDRLLGLLTPARLIPAARHRQLQPLAPRQRRDQAQHAERQQLVLQIALGDALYGFALEQVRRIIDYRLPEPVQAEAGALVTGAVNIEGRVVPVVDLAAHLRSTGANDGAWVIVGDGRHEWAIAVREATDIVSVPESALEPVKAGDDGFVSAIARVQDRLMSLLSLAPLSRGVA